MSLQRTALIASRGIVQQYRPAPGLQPRNWEPGNYSILKTWLAELSESRDLPRASPVTAVFDFDNTCIYGDVGKAVFRYQLSKLHFRLSPEELEVLFPEHPESLASKPFAAIKNRIVTLYRVLWPYISSKRRQEALQLPEHHEFRTLLSWYCRESQRQKGLGPEYSLAFMTQLLAGYSTAEVEDLSCMAIVASLYEPIGTEKKRVRCSDPLGVIEVSTPTGLRLQPEILDLMRQLARAGVLCAVVSATAEWVVKAAAIFFDFPVAEDNIFGIRVQLTRENILSTRLPENYPLTYRQGKVAVIQEIIARTPIFVAGDAVTDLEMLTLPGVTHRLLVNHNRADLISSLYDDPRFLLQGIDKETGSFRPFRATLEKIEEELRCHKQQFSFQKSLDNAV